VKSALTSILLTTTLLLSLFSTVSLSGQDNQYKIAAVGFYNVENLFDTINTIDVWDTEFTPEGSVLEDLVNHPNLKEKDFGIVHHDSPDERGIDVALLYRKKHFKVTNSKPYFVDISPPNKTNYTRDILLVSGELDGDPMHFLVNHWPSRSGGEKRSEPGRAKAGDVAKHIIDSLNILEVNAKIILMGDLNDNPTNKSLVDHLGAKNKLRSVKKQEMYNPMADLFKKGYGSNAWRDTWSLFDQVIVSEGLLNKKAEGFQFHKAGIHNKKYLIQSIGQYKGYPYRTFVGDAFQGGYSDHFPVYVYLVKKV